MRKNNPNYKLSKIYKITCSDTGLIYIGATTLPLNYRIQHHTSPFNPCRTKLMKNPEIELLFPYPCETKKELDMKEAEVIRHYKLVFKDKCINCKMPLRTIQEYNIEFKEQIAEKRKIMYKKNSEMYKEKQRNYYRIYRGKQLKIKRLKESIKAEIEKAEPREKWLIKWNKKLLALKSNHDDEIVVNSYLKKN